MISQKILNDVATHNEGIDMIVERLKAQGMSQKVIDSFLEKKIDPTTL